MGSKFFFDGFTHLIGEVVEHDDLEILVVQGQVPPEELRELFGTFGIRKFQNWMNGQTMGEIGPYIHDVIRYMKGQAVVD